MRLLSTLLAGVALTVAPAAVSGACTGAGTGTPSPNAIVWFVSNIVTKGSFQTSSSSSSTSGLAGADNICNADSRGPARTAKVVAAKNLFRAFLSNQLTNAVDRFITGDTSPGGLVPLDPTWDIVDANGNCLAPNLSWMLDCQHDDDLNDVFSDSRGNYYTTGSTVEVFTGTNCDGSRWHLTGSTGALTDPGQIQQAYCSQVNPDTLTPDPNDLGWSYSGSDPTVAATIGQIYLTEPLAQFSNPFIETSDGTGPLGMGSCVNGIHLYCLQTGQAPTQPPGGNGDPQFTGLQGQSFQVHGMPEEYFNLISSPDMQLNSRFAYLASGTCNYNNTECWTHPGTYVDQLGFMFPGIQIKAVSGSHDNGMIVHVNDARIEVSKHSHKYDIHAHHSQNHTQVVRVTHPTHDTLVVQTHMFTVTATNSDMFFNFGVEFHDRSLLSAGSAVHHIHDGEQVNSVYPAFPLHGLLGQTWKNARYQHGHMFQGQVDDYMILDGKLFSNKFIYNTYKH